MQAQTTQSESNKKNIEDLCVMYQSSLEMSQDSLHKAILYLIRSIHHIMTSLKMLRDSLHRYNIISTSGEDH